MTNVDLVENLCSVSPVLREARRAHLGKFGTLIPHVFMSDVLARVGRCLGPGAEATEQPSEAVAILGELERGLVEGGRETRNVIAVSFVNDSELEPFVDVLRPFLGPALQAQLQGK